MCSYRSTRQLHRSALREIGPRLIRVVSIFLLGRTEHWLSLNGARFKRLSRRVTARLVPDLTFTAHIKFNSRLKLQRQGDQLILRAPENVLSGCVSGKAIKPYSP